MAWCSGEPDYNITITLFYLTVWKELDFFKSVWTKTVSLLIPILLTQKLWLLSYQTLLLYIKILKFDFFDKTKNIVLEQYYYTLEKES